MENNFEDPESENIEFIFPEEWKLGTFIDVTGNNGIFIDGDWVESKDQDPNGEIRLIQLADIGDGIFKNKSQRFLTRQKAGELDCTYLSQGDLLISRLGDPLGKCCIFPGDPKPSITAVDICIVRPGNFKADPKWLMYVINSPEFRKRINHFKRGTTRARISRKNLATLPIPLPPLAEQQHLVACIEALLTHINAARDRLSRVPLIMTRFRQGVLAAACSGRLTGGWREENPDVETAIELLQKIKPEVRGKKVNAKQATNDFFEFDQFELPNSWTWTTTSDICTEISDGDHYPPPKFSSGVPFIVISNISSGSIDFTKTMFASQKYYDELANNRKPQFGDILYTVTGSYGIPVIVDTHKEFCFQRHIALLRPHPMIPSEFLWILMKSEMIYQQSKSIATGIAQLTVPLSGLRVLKIPLPPLAEQHEIVRRVGALFERADAFDQEVAAAGRRCERLTQAVLGKAFRGELVERKLRFSIL